MANLQNPFSANKKKGLAFWLIISFLYVSFSLYTSQTYNAYMALNNLVEYRITDTIKCYSIAFTKQSLYNFNITAVIKIFCYKWWYHALFFLMILYVRMSSRANGFRGIEGGSSNIATEEQKEAYRDETGIPIAKDLYVALKNHEYQIKKAFGRVKTVVQRTTSNLNQLIIGSSGCGKSFRAIESQLLQGKNLGNFVVTDPKGELFTNTAKFFEKEGYDVTVLNLFEPQYSSGYNPFVYAKTENDIINLADMFMKASSGEGQKADFWTGSALQMLTACMLYIKNTEDERQDFRRVLELISSISYTDGFISLSCEYAQCMQSYCQNHLNKIDAVTIYWKSVKGIPEQTLGGVVATLSERLRLWLAECIDCLTREDEMSFDDFANPKKHKIIYIIVPPSSTTYAGVVTMFYSQLFKELEAMAIKAKGRLPIMCNCIMDEFANTTQIKDFCQILAVVRGYNIRLCMALQSFAQLKKLYEKDADTIVANCGIITYLGTQGDTETAKWLIEHIGKTTIRKEGHSTNFGNTGGGSNSESAEGRNLFESNELSRFAYGLTLQGNQSGAAEKYGGRCINLVNTLVICDYKFDTFKHKNFKYLGSLFTDEAKKWLTDMSEFHAKKKGKVKDVKINTIEPDAVKSAEELFIENGGNLNAPIDLDDTYREITDASIEAERMANENAEMIRDIIEQQNLEANNAENAILEGDDIEDLLLQSERLRWLQEDEINRKEKEEKEKAEIEAQASMANWAAMSDASSNAPTDSLPISDGESLFADEDADFASLFEELEQQQYADSSVDDAISDVDAFFNNESSDVVDAEITSDEDEVFRKMFEEAYENTDRENVNQTERQKKIDNDFLALLNG